MLHGAKIHWQEVRQVYKMATRNLQNQLIQNRGVRRTDHEGFVQDGAVGSGQRQDWVLE